MFRNPESSFRHFLSCLGLVLIHFRARLELREKRRKELAVLASSSSSRFSMAGKPGLACLLICYELRAPVE